MAEATTTWPRHGAWSGIASAGRLGREGEPGLVVDLLQHPQLATIVAFRGRTEEIARRLQESFSIAAPDGPALARSQGLLLIGTGPAQWLACAADDVIERLSAELAGLAAITAQGDGRAALRLSGPKVREVLAKGLPIDLDPSVFGPDGAATTAIHHVGIQIWQSDPAPAYEILVPRSFAGSFWRWLESSAGEFGLLVRDS